MKRFFYIFLILFFTTCSAFAQKKYAVLIVGDPSVSETNIPPSDLWKGDGTGEADEFWNDTYLMWEMLQNKGFHADSIFVLFADGNDRHPNNPRYNPGNSVTITDGSATIAHVCSLFEDLRFGTHGKPQIMEDDFLFVWIFDHGGYDSNTNHSYFHLYNNGSMSDVTFANLVNPIPAHRKVFLMQQCHGGGFSDDLSAINTVFISASQVGQSAYPADDKRLTGEYGGCTPYIENESYYNNDSYRHGEFDYHMISVINRESPDHLEDYDGEPYANFDFNGDSIISMMEAYRWDTVHNSRKTSVGVHWYDMGFEDSVYDDLGNIGQHISFEYPTLLFDSIVNIETHRGIIGISKDLVVANGQTLTFTGKSDVTLCDSVTLVIEEGATLVIDGKVNFSGTTNNLLIIHGSLIQNNGSSLSFSDMQVFSDATELSVTGAEFKNTELKYKPAGSSSIAESSALTGNVTITNCRFLNSSKQYAILIENSRSYDINGDTISNCLGNGIYIKNCGNAFSFPNHYLCRKIRNNVISGCSNSGLVLYATTGEIFTNKIYGNGVGVKLLNKCNILNFNGNCAAFSEAQTQYIHDNTSYEIYMTSNCNPQYMNYNSIHKTNAGSTPFICFDHTAAFDDNPNHRGNIDVRRNEWGNNFNPITHLYSTTPSVGFDTLPYWGFHDCHEWPNPDGRLLSVADSLCNAGAYDSARSIYFQVVKDYPNTISAETALKILLLLESHTNRNYEALKHYFVSDTIIGSHETLLKLSSFLANRCDEILANYDNAISWYEGVITNPETAFADSIFATIDLGNLYLEMEGNGTKSTSGKLLQFKPKSRSAFEMQCEHALSLLPSSRTISEFSLVQRENPYPLWADTIISQPEGYIMDDAGNVEISSSDGLVWLISAVNGLNGCEPDDFEGRTVRLANDIDFGVEGWSLCFSPIGTRETPFLGTFDGDGHKIHHLCQWYSQYDGVNNYYFDMGVFGYIRHATMKNVTLDSTCRIYSTCDYPGYYRGGMVGFADSLSVVDNIYIHTQGTKFDYGGSLVGMNRNSIVRNCAFGGHDYNSAPTKEGGGLVSYNRSDGGIADAVVENCYFYGNITVAYNNPQYLAGLVSFNETMPNNNGKQAIVRNCHSTPTDRFIARCYGSLVSVISEGSSVRNCYTDLTKMHQYGRMIGLNEGGEFSDCSEYTNIDGIGTLAFPVTINETTTDNLLDALNLWIANQEHPELYRTWTIINDSIPMFGDYYVGIPENEDLNNWVTVHPNPTLGYVSVRGENLRQAEVVNMLGQLVIRVESEGNELQIDISIMPSGIYFVTVTDKEGRTSVQKVVKE